MIARFLLLAFSLAAASLAAEFPRAAPGEVGLSQDRLDRITAAMKEDVDQGYLAGAIGVVARRGKIAYWETVGLADIEAETPLRDDAIFRIYSMTKPIVGVALMTLYEEGKFSLREPVKKYIPELGDAKVLVGKKAVQAKREMTIQDLMRHTAGLTYGLFGKSPADDLYVEADLLSGNSSVDDFIQKLAKLPLKHQPGSAWEYSVSVDVQGRLIEVLSGMDLAAFMSERVFKPLGMRDTGFTVPPGKKDRFVELYQKTEDEQSIEPAPAGRSKRYYDYESAWYSGGGGLVSTTRDYLRFCQMLLNRGELDGVRVLKPETVDLMLTNQLPEGIGHIDPRVATPGNTFGIDFALVEEPDGSTDHARAKGEAWWYGVGGTWFGINPTQDLAIVGMIQNMGGAGARRARLQSKRIVYDAIMDEATP